jgi:ankyrin repeat protein
MPLFLSYFPFQAPSSWAYGDLIFAIFLSFGFEVVAKKTMDFVRLWCQQSPPCDPALLGTTALKAHLEYEGQSEDMMIVLLDAGLDLGEINKPDGYACEVYQWAASKGYLRVAQRLLRKGVAVDIYRFPGYPVGSHGPTALYLAARAGHPDMVSLLITNSANVNGIGLSEYPPLLGAVQQLHHGPTIAQQISIISILIGAKADVNIADANGRSVLSLATMPLTHEAMMLFISAGADPNLADNDGMTPLHYASKCAHSAGIISNLLSAGASINALDAKGTSALTYVGWSGDCPDAMKVLLTNGADVTMGGGIYGSPLGAAARLADVSMMEMLIDAGAQVNHQDNQTKYHSPLFAALERSSGGRQFEAVSVLLRRGADVSLKDGQGRQALHKAVSKIGNTNADTLKALIANGADVNATFDCCMNFLDESIDSVPMTPLGYLCQYFIDAQAALVLVESGADPNSRTPNGENILHAVCGASCSSDVLVDTLLKKGADARARTSNGATPLHYAAKRRKTEAVRLLMEHDVLIDAIDDKMQTPLHCACRDASDTKSDIEVVQLLLANGACVTDQDITGMTPLHFAAKAGNESIVSMLLEAGGADLAMMRDKRGRNVLHFAAETCPTSVLKILLTHTCHGLFNEPDDEGNTCLHYAAKAGAEKNVQMLISTRDIDVQIRSHGGYTPLDLAVKEGHIWVVLALRKGIKR